MKGLLLKDFYTLFKQMKFFLILILLFSIAPEKNMYGFAIVYSALLPITALAFDERSKWNIMARMMPYTPFQIVFSKYIIGYTAMLFASAVTFAAGFVMSKDIGFFGSEFAPSIAAVMLSAMILLAICMPLMYKFGTEKGRLLYFLMFGLCFAGIVVVGGLADNELSIGASNAVFIAATMAAIAVILNVISVFLSVHIFKNSAE